jgi:hypothetical protein
MPTPRRVRRLREGMIVRLNTETDLSQYLFSTPLSPQNAFRVSWSRTEGMCNYQRPDYLEHHHSVRLMLSGFGDILCDRIFERIRVPKCEHICAPNCVCLDSALRDLGLTISENEEALSRGRHRYSSPPR